MTSTPAGRPGATTTTRAHRARRGEGELLRDELMDAAEALLVEHGHPDQVSMRAVARRVGVTPPAIYLHFTDKDELFFATCERRFTELAELTVEALRGIEDAPSRIRAIGRSYVRWGLANREHYAVIMGNVVEPPAGIDVTTLSGYGAFTVLLRVIEEGIAAGQLRDDLAPVEIAVSLWATVHGYVSLTSNKQPFVPQVDLPAAQEAVLDAALRGLLPPAPTDGS